MFEKYQTDCYLESLDFSKLQCYSGKLENACIISVQHLLGSVNEMFAPWFELGLKAENIHVLGKCYSSDQKIIEEMKAKGIQVSPYSSAFHSHIAYDDLFDEVARGFLISRMEKCRSFKKMILLDDEGDLINIVTDIYRSEAARIVRVEQTLSGYEPGWVSQRIVDKTFEKLNKDPERILIIGKGAIGSSIYSLLSNQYEVQLMDIQDSPFLMDNSIQTADLIFGCTGTVSIPHYKHCILKKGCVLSSGSCSDREFDSVYIRKQFAPSRDCHADFENGQFKLLNCGFPVNFT